MAILLVQPSSLELPHWDTSIFNILYIPSCVAHFVQCCTLEVPMNVQKHAVHRWTCCRFDEAIDFHEFLMCPWFLGARVLAEGTFPDYAALIRLAGAIVSSFEHVCPYHWSFFSNDTITVSAKHNFRSWHFEETPFDRKFRGSQQDSSFPVTIKRVYFGWSSILTRECSLLSLLLSFNKYDYIT